MILSDAEEAEAEADDAKGEEAEGVESFEKGERGLQ